MSNLKELEKRLRNEPDNLGLRVALAGALHEAGRRDDAVELYRSVAIAYRSQGRTQQAILVCRSVLEIAPDDASCAALLAAMVAELAPPAEPPAPPEAPIAPAAPVEPPAPAVEPPAVERAAPRGDPSADQPRRAPPPVRHEPPPLAPPELEATADLSEPSGLSSLRSSVSDMTPLPAPLPHHVAEPTRPPPGKSARLARVELPLPADPDQPPRRPTPTEPLSPDDLRPASVLALLPPRSPGRTRPPPPPIPARAAIPVAVSAADAAHDDAVPDDIDDDDEERTGNAAIPVDQILPRLAGIASAARQISATLLAAGSDTEPVEQTDGSELVDDEDLIEATDATHIDDELDGDPRQPARVDPHAEIERLVAPRPTIPLSPAARRARDASDRITAGPDRPSYSVFPARPSRPSISRVQLVDDEKTRPRELPAQLRTSTEPEDELAPAPAPASSAGAFGPASVTESGHAPGPTSTGAPAAARGGAGGAPHAVDPLDSALLSLIPPHNRAAVLQRFRRRLAAVGTTVIRRGETEHGLVLVVRGRLDVHTERSDGARVSLEAVAPGDYVGEISLLFGEPAAAYVVAAAESELLVLAAVEFYEVTGAFPALRAELEAVAARRVRAHEQRLRV